MFSVDNFYDFVDSHYGVKNSKNVIWKFSPNGSKDFNDLKPIHIDHVAFQKQRGYYATLGSIVMHDQEPLSTASLDTYRESLRIKKKLSAELFDPTEVLALRFFTCSWPIWCHSEENSPDVRSMEGYGFVGCHYFWHGFIARDWFRHWRYHADINNDHPWSQRFLMYCRALDGSREYRTSVLSALRPLGDQIRSTWGEDSEISADYSARIVPEDACDSAIQIVLETIFDQDKIYVTEKIFKPIVMRQPFVVFAAPGTLKYLKKYGFRTFDEIWDESYDQERDHAVRQKKIIKLINDLYRMPKTKFLALLERCQAIVEHNQRHFFSQRFEDRLLKELHKNIGQSIQESQQRSLEYPGGIFFQILDDLHRRREKLPSKENQNLHQVLPILQNTYPKRYQRICQQYPWVKSLT